MKDWDPEEYLVSVQWGKGFHYFITPKPTTMTRAQKLADQHTTLLHGRISRRGALPTVRVLRIAKTILLTRNQD